MAHKCPKVRFPGFVFGVCPPDRDFWGKKNAPARNAAVPSNLGWKKHPLGALGGPRGAGRPAGILTFFWFFQNGLKRSPRALGGPGGPWGPYFPLFLPYFGPPGGPLGGPWGGPWGPPISPYLPLRAAALWGSTSGAVYTGRKVYECCTGVVVPVSVAYSLWATETTSVNCTGGASPQRSSLKGK